MELERAQNMSFDSKVIVTTRTSQMAEGSLSIFAVLLNDLKTMQALPNKSLHRTPRICHAACSGNPRANCWRW